MCLSYAGAVYRLPHIYRSGGRSVSFRFVSFRSSPNNFCTATKAPPLSLFLFPFRLLHHPPFILFFFSLSLPRASSSLSVSLSPFSLFVRRSSRLRIFVRIAIAEGFFPLASLVPRVPDRVSPLSRSLSLSPFEPSFSFLSPFYVATTSA